MDRDYGYRLFVDDLPSATIVEGMTHYEYTVPLGFVAEKMSKNTYRTYGIYNHLDIKIKVHPTLKSDLFGQQNPSSIDIPLPGGPTFSVPMPE